MAHTRTDAFDLVGTVQRAQAGCERAFALLYRRFTPLVHAVLLARLPTAVAEELSQECFLLAYRRLPQLREPARFAGWLTMIARRLRNAEPPPSTPLEQVVEPVDRGTAPDQTAEAEAVFAAIRRIPAAYREPLLLRLVEGLSGPEIAELTGLSAGSVRVNLHRGMHRLRAELGLAARGDEEDHHHD